MQKQELLFEEQKKKIDLEEMGLVEKQMKEQESKRKKQRDYAM